MCLCACMPTRCCTECCIRCCTPCAHTQSVGIMHACFVTGRRNYDKRFSTVKSKSHGSRAQTVAYRPVDLLYIYRLGPAWPYNGCMASHALAATTLGAPPNRSTPSNLYHIKNVHVLMQSVKKHLNNQRVQLPEQHRSSIVHSARGAGAAQGQEWGGAAAAPLATI